ncbi:hypothetical protein COLO4_25445 [Corchorus olitorius]|uniref:Uncharacterized protein n=1 Tax=Corchorus olitorius TaxID=93759 RepID=A0A1R3I2J3_9ROSI|nr:hypothetical protein COLO4_25445 [Corchorus olitorius]
MKQPRPKDTSLKGVELDGHLQSGEVAVFWCKCASFMVEEKYEWLRSGRERSQRFDGWQKWRSGYEQSGMESEGGFFVEGSRKSPLSHSVFCHHHDEEKGIFSASTR